MSQALTLIAVGRAADIYLRDDGRIVQLFHSGIPVEVAYEEIARVQAAKAAGVNTPVLREAVEHEGRFGIALDRVDGEVMVLAVANHPERAEDLGRQLAELHADLHGRFGSSFPPLHEMLRRRIREAKDVPEAHQETALAALDRLPAGLALCHGDFHPENVTLTVAGPIISNWFNATAGCPAADVARTTLLLRFRGPDEGVDPQVIELVNRIRPPFQNAYWQRYSELRPTDAEQSQAWMLPVAAAYLADPLTEHERQELLALVERLVRWSKG